MDEHTTWWCDVEGCREHFHFGESEEKPWPDTWTYNIQEKKLKCKIHSQRQLPDD